ncbi:hypothetical protein PILCRDRAFT_812228 [Piloderma croceum F 1598]|uniref:Uncharacterized protein n=1 Tax=Piloderma croceum (strain F 1598) TaxID=765440 RepID=A0A0C3G288_PILCF|nr:hypothetical protein PILCRDRAFT_812228 [Piloderma croceum F 1598]
MDITSVRNVTFSSREDKNSFRSDSSKASSSSYKFLERQIIRAWKRITRATRKQPRASFLPADFVLVTARRRRSALLG